MASTTNTNTPSPEDEEEVDVLKNQGNDAFRKVCKIFSRLYFFVGGLIC